MRFAEIARVSFTRGTRITMSSSVQVPIEDIRVGDNVLTRDYSPQSVRWIGETTLRAVGEFAPVVIRNGALHNANNLILSPDHGCPSISGRTDWVTGTMRCWSRSAT
jgi:hypothetical protein